LYAPSALCVHVHGCLGTVCNRPQLEPELISASQSSAVAPVLWHASSVPACLQPCGQHGRPQVRTYSSTCVHARGHLSAQTSLCGSCAATALDCTRENRRRHHVPGCLEEGCVRPHSVCRQPSLELRHSGRQRTHNMLPDHTIRCTLARPHGRARALTRCFDHDSHPSRQPSATLWRTGSEQGTRIYYRAASARRLRPVSCCKRPFPNAGSGQHSRSGECSPHIQSAALMTPRSTSNMYLVRTDP